MNAAASVIYPSSTEVPLSNRIPAARSTPKPPISVRRYTSLDRLLLRLNGMTDGTHSGKCAPSGSRGPKFSCDLTRSGRPARGRDDRLRWRSLALAPALPSAGPCRSRGQEPKQRHETGDSDQEDQEHDRSPFRVPAYGGAHVVEFWSVVGRLFGAESGYELSSFVTAFLGVLIIILSDDN